MAPNEVLRNASFFIQQLKTDEYSTMFTSPTILKAIHDMWPENIERVFDLGLIAFDRLFDSHPDIKITLFRSGNEKADFVIQRSVLALLQTFQKAITFLHENQQKTSAISIDKFSEDMSLFGSKLRYMMPNLRVGHFHSLLNSLVTIYAEKCIPETLRRQGVSQDKVVAHTEQVKSGLSEIVKIMNVHVAFGFEYEVYRPIEDELRMVGQNKVKIALPGLTVHGSFLQLATQRMYECTRIQKNNAEPIGVEEVKFAINF